jgi:hypothetical protein
MHYGVLFWQAIASRFELLSTAFTIQYYDVEWREYVDVEDYSSLADKTKVKCIEDKMGFQQQTPRLCVHSQTPRSCVNSSASENSPQLQLKVTVEGSWPTCFEFPISKLPAKVNEAPKNETDLTLPKQKHLCGLLLNILCDEAVKFISHSNCVEKNDMAKSRIVTWPHLREPVGRGYDGWLTSIVDCLTAKRRALGIIDKGQSLAIRKRGALNSVSPPGLAKTRVKPVLSNPPGKTWF